jgi:acyl-CoA dehydrogenase
VLARTSPRDELPTDHGLSLFLVDLRDARARGRSRRAGRDDAQLPDLPGELPRPAGAGERLIGEEGRGFRYVLDGWNAERTLLAAEAIGDGRWFLDRATAYANDRVVFGRPIGQNQGVAFPLPGATPRWPRPT